MAVLHQGEVGGNENKRRRRRLEAALVALEKAAAEFSGQNSQEASRTLAEMRAKFKMCRAIIGGKSGGAEDEMREEGVSW